MGMLSQTSTGVLKLRRAAAADVEAVDLLLKRSYPRLLKRDYPPSTMVTAVPMLARANPTLIGSGRYYVIEEAGRVLAAGGWSKSSPSRLRGRAGIGHVRHVATDPDVLRMGLGQALLSHILNDARRNDVTEMQCLSTRTAQRFYQSLGFEAGRELDIPLAQGISFPAIEMWLKL